MTRRHEREGSNYPSAGYSLHTKNNATTCECHGNEGGYQEATNRDLQSYCVIHGARDGMVRILQWSKIIYMKNAEQREYLKRQTIMK